MMMKNGSFIGVINSTLSVCMSSKYKFLQNRSQQHSFMSSYDCIVIYGLCADMLIDWNAQPCFAGRIITATKQNIQRKTSGFQCTYKVQELWAKDTCKHALLLYFSSSSKNPRYFFSSSEKQGIIKSWPCVVIFLFVLLYLSKSIS